jgi:hypothetical protein
MAGPDHTALAELLRHPRETLDIEIKGWLDLADANQRADLAKAIIALANSGGGHLVVGLAEDDGSNFAAVPGTAGQITSFSADAVQDAVQKYIDPPIQCRTEQVEHPTLGCRFPVIIVPGGHRAPVRAKAGSPDGKLVANRVYIRRPGPRSEEPANSGEWTQLFDQCVRAGRDELVSAMRDFILGSFTWRGLRGRDLAALTSRYGLSPGRRNSSQDTFAATCSVRASAIPTTLPEIVFEMIAPLYELFGFFALPKSRVDHAIRDLMRHQFQS